MSNVDEVKKTLAKFQKEFDAEVLEHALQQTEDFAKETYNDLKNQFETIVVRSESKKKPVVAKVDTNIEITRAKDNKSTTINITAASKLEKDVVTTVCHGTGMRIRPDIVNFVAAKSGAAVADSQTPAKLGDLYIDPSNADTKFLKRIEKALIKND